MQKVKRLFDQFKPASYTLSLDIDREKMSFHGTVVITGKKFHQPNHRITFHQSGLRITSAKITHHDKTGEHDMSVDRINHHGAYDEVRLHSKQKLYPGTYSVQLHFSGKISRNMEGIYPCYFKVGGKDKTLIATQFESHQAREAFPCIDEPEAKATFDLTLVSPTGETVLANTPVKERHEDGSKTISVFETTPVMSTYLLAFVFGELGYKEAKTKDGVRVRAYATPDNVAHTEFALNLAVKCLEFYNAYFNIPYPLEKCDLIALPDFASGAMENWGLITFREQCMLVDEKHTSLGTKQFIAMVVAHELAHMWFGNLVTMRWWTDLWLNEGFASWIEYLAVDKVFPEWEVWTQFIVDEQQSAMRLDELEHTHPIEVPVNHPDEIRTIFDAISYAKGASVIHMLHDYLGADMFRDGLRFYLNKHAYGNTDTVDLWSALETVSGKPVKAFMHAWTSKPGYPIVHAEITDTGLHLEQRRFFINPGTREHFGHWPVPLLAAHPGIPALLEDREISLTPHDLNKLKLNRSQSGFYRVAYNASHQERLAELVRLGRLTPLDRLGLLDDVFEATKAAHTSTVEALHLLESFKDESNAAVWDVIAAGLGSIRMAMDDEALRESMKPYIRSLVKKQLERLGWDRKDGESHFDRLLRPTILAMAAYADEPAVVEKSLKLFKAMHEPEDIDSELRNATSVVSLKRDISIDPDLRGVVYGVVVRRGGKTEFDKLLSMHNQTTHSEERTTISSALTGFEEPELVARALSLITTDVVRLQDVGYWVAYSFANRFAKKATWDWMVTNWKWLSENLSNDLSFYRLPIYSARSSSDEAFLKKYKEFFEPLRSPGIDRSISQGAEIVTWQMAWKKRDLASVKHFFESYQSTATSSIAPAASTSAASNS